ncbi:MAG: peptidoglycan DD-metalloendopeptidase family protein [Candidatus Eremiobacteraeota bacterium]|nr:peptidoglycan DD-metalloendopeptidase family protein [Candidatus Eremiobacteraeota bacterium]
MAGFMNHLAQKLKRPCHVTVAAALLFLLATSASHGEGEVKNKGEHLRTLRMKMDVKKKLIQQSQGRLHYEKFRLSVMNGRERDLSAQLQTTETNLWSVEEAIRNLNDRRVRVTDEIAVLRARIKVLRDRLDSKQKHLLLRLRDIYTNREINYFSVILESENFSDFINRVEFFQRIVKADTEMIAEFKAEKKKLSNEQARLEELESELVAMEKEQRKKQYSLQGLRNTRSGILAEVSLQRNQIANNVYEMELLTKELESQLEGLIREEQAMNQNNTKEGPIRSEARYIWPAKGFLTSAFGYRMHPIRGIVIFHSGIDIGALYGTPVVSAASGIVIYSGWYGGYGNAVIIDHGGGYSSLYAHCSTLYVVKRQKVSQGSLIASVGSTGMSTGPHLHFEIRQNGVPIDPRGKL